MFGKRITGSAPRNTATPAGFLEVALEGFQGSPEAGAAIRKQEAEGQRSFTTSDTLPANMSGDDRKVLTKAGVKFGQLVQGDNLFVYATLPAGWHKDGSDHDMWSYLVDSMGRQRASIFYKAAFYDRDAFLRTNRRFGVSKDYEYEEANEAIKYTVTDGGSVVFTTKAYSFTDEKYSDDWRQKDKAANDEALAWLKENFPKWEDTGAYWD